MSQLTGSAPGVTFREQIEEATKTVGITNRIGIVGVAVKGPEELTLLTSEQQCISIFGAPHANNSAVKGALACLKNGSEVWFKRVVGSSAAQGATWSTGEDKPWAVFTTKEKTDTFNGYSVSLTWSVEGSDADPIHKITYELKDAAGTVIESFRCDEDDESPMYLGRVIALYSKYVTVEIAKGVPTRTAITGVIAGGDSGLTVTAADIVGTGNTGMKAFYDSEGVDISTLVVPGWADAAVWAEGVAVCNYRKDVMFIPSLPTGLTPNEVINIVTGVAATGGYKFDHTSIALYWPNGVINNTATGGVDVVDIAPYVAAAYAKSDSIANVWTAPAGVKRGTIEGLDGLEYYATKEERDQLYADTVNINPVVNIKNYGITIMGSRTSKLYQITDANKALRYVNIRRLCDYARKVVMAESMYNLFDFNDYYTWNDWKMRIDPYFREIQESRGLYDYQIIMDETTVSQEDIDEGRMPGLIKIAPVKPNEYIIINFVVASDGTVSFAEPEVIA